MTTPALAIYVSIMAKQTPALLNNYCRWEDWEKSYLIKYYASKGRKHCALHLGRSPKSVHQMAMRLKCCAKGKNSKHHAN